MRSENPLVGQLRRWLGAIPLAWRDDAAFRWAALVAIACLAAFLVGRSGGDTGTAPAAAPGPPLPPPTTAAALAPPPAAPRIVPGHPLSGTVVLPEAPDTDRFGRAPARP